MDRIKIALNLRKPGNYAFFCPVSKLHLTRSNPVGFADRVTSAILVGIKYKTLIDVDGVVDLKTGKIIDNSKEENITADIQEQQPVDIQDISDTKENTEAIEEAKAESNDSTEEVKEEPKKRGRKPNK